MGKRLTWMGIGLVAGLGTSKWLEVKARRRLEQLVPGGRLTLDAGAELRSRAGRAARNTTAQVRSALEEGRLAKAQREEDLRRQLHLVVPSRGR
ncbi:MAG TPA: hypothetical protein VME20_04955 [Acidimicrobiales bacterium]|nr:hypothetical protein [Acidimicrobiales bacterium]